MNRILVTARKVRGASEAEIAGLLGISAFEYQAIECRSAALAVEHAQKLGGYYAVPAWYFLDAVESLNADARIRFLRAQLGILGKPEYRAMPPGASVALATTVIELMIARDELAAALSRELALTEDLAALTRMYEHLCAAAPETGL